MFPVAREREIERERENERERDLSKSMTMFQLSDMSEGGKEGALKEETQSNTHIHTKKIIIQSLEYKVQRDYMG